MALLLLIIAAIGAVALALFILTAIAGLYLLFIALGIAWMIGVYLGSHLFDGPVAGLIGGVVGVAVVLVGMGLLGCDRARR